MTKLSEIFGAAFDASAVEPQQSFDVLPAGVYTLEITESEVRDTKRGDGKILKVTHDVIDPAEYVGRKVWANITLKNPNAQAERIGAQQLSGLSRACGISALDEIDELLGKVVRAKIAVKPGKDGYEPQNVINHYESAGVSTPPAPKPSAAAPTNPSAAAPTKQAPANTAPWAKRAA